MKNSHAKYTKRLLSKTLVGLLGSYAIKPVTRTLFKKHLVIACTEVQYLPYLGTRAKIDPAQNQRVSSAKFAHEKHFVDRTR